MRTKVVFSTLVMLSALALVFSSKALAQDSATSASSTNPTETPQVTTNTGTTKPTGLFKPFERTSVGESTKSGEPRFKLGLDRLKDKRLQFCENHKDEINNRLTSLGNLVANILGKFDAIATRVEQFYNSKVVPSGKSVPNYDSLVADIATKKAAVNTALSNAQADVKTFTCTADNPKGQLKLFRTDMQTVKKALQDYRTSIKNLIVAVKSVVGETENGSPKPSESSESAKLKSPTPVPSPI